ncbi:MAG: nucleotidyl transferase AbiEii/AbiGii toxin family protein [Chloroflexota bacterium]
MITTAELHRAASREGLRFDQAEKDYVILLILSALVRTLSESAQWVFKGGTCLRHCYYAGFRFSEDIDFSCRSGKDNAPASASVLIRTAQLVQNESGLEMAVSDAQQSAGQEQLEIAVHYSRGGLRRQGLPAVRVHLTFDEPVLVPPPLRRVQPPYTEPSPFPIASYSIIEIVAEKMRALIQQQDKWPRPRDLYDLWFILCHKAERLPAAELQDLFARKCAVKNITPDLRLLISDALKEWNRRAWKNQLAPMMKNAPEYETVWNEWVHTCRGLMFAS